MAYRKSARSGRRSARSYSPRRGRGGARAYAGIRARRVSRGRSGNTVRLVISHQVPEGGASNFVTPGLRPGLIATPKPDGRSRF